MASGRARARVLASLVAEIWHLPEDEWSKVTISFSVKHTWRETEVHDEVIKITDVFDVERELE